ncbi:MAG: 2-amino-4-hydroxy-6-hydroxymethyldihydropteridine diphosphokinase [Verrucomicrobia bacterium]|nr:MAG: 2-amino-4-hydroxy-6-hydroxymethyldihydropteridine diphosphokinase [Verrucomicrobiota bacterium]
MPIGIALGSNLGESKMILKKSIEELLTIHNGAPETFLRSSFYKTAPLDCPLGSPPFLNAAIQLETQLSPYEVLVFLQAMELQAGRPNKRDFHAPRTLDLDLLYYNSITIVSPQLVLPHPRIQHRFFVLKPLVDINPDLILPGWEKTAASYLELLETTDI